MRELNNDNNSLYVITKQMRQASVIVWAEHFSNSHFHFKNQKKKVMREVYIRFEK